MGNPQKIPVLTRTDGKKSVVWEALFALYFFFFEQNDFRYETDVISVNISHNSETDN